MAAIEQQSGITTWMSERPRCDQMHEPFGQGCLQRPERLFGNDRLLPFIHLVIKALRPGAKTNLLVYLEGRRCSFHLSGGAVGDEIILIRDPKEKTFEVKFHDK
ncbi:MAG: hypothetical protein L6Q37_12200 [Bdellovibrionaceae bacterium]|nr:hypothetical protein [Pseudobdellovibrionaceae bacterium]